jgi:transcriptional regulator with XRE-family HTH domain
MSENNSVQRSVVAVEEGFVVEVQSYLQELMNNAGISRSELARRMGVSRARVTQIFSDECTNLTIRLLAKAAHAMGEVPRVESELTRRLRAAREDEDRQALIYRSGNVVPIWQDTDSTDPADADCVGTDPRLDRIVERLRVAGGGR